MHLCSGCGRTAAVMPFIKGLYIHGDETAVSKTKNGGSSIFVDRALKTHLQYGMTQGIPMSCGVAVLHVPQCDAGGCTHCRQCQDYQCLFGVVIFRSCCRVFECDVR